MKRVIFKQPNDISCLPTCVASLLRSYGEDIELEDVIAEAKKQGYLYGGGMSAYNISKFVSTLTGGKYSAFSIIDCEDKIYNGLIQKDTKKIKNCCVKEIVTGKPIILTLEFEVNPPEKSGVYHHSVILFDRKDGKYIIGDPATGTIEELPSLEIEKIYPQARFLGEVIRILPSSETKNEPRMKIII